MRIVTEEQLAAILGELPGSPRVVAGGNLATPTLALDIFDGSVESYQLFVLNAHGQMPDRDGVALETPFVGPAMRDKPGLRYFPSRLSLVPFLLRRNLPPDVVLIQTTVAEAGTVSLGIEVNILPAAIEVARSRGGLVVAEMNKQMPFIYGDGVLSCDDIDLAIETDRHLPVGLPRAVDDVSGLIAERVAALVPPGATLQMGIGSVPDATLAALRDRRGLGVWSEMFSDGVLALEEAGALESDHPVTASFVFGTDELYEWVHRNQRVRLLRTEKTNDPGLISKQPALVSVNSALEVDLYGQANASRLGRKVYSGFGGQTDFVVGALHSPGGVAIIALPSWHPRAGVSTVVPLLEGAVTSFQHSYIVTEQGAASIWGYDAHQQARHIIEHAAHPNAREELRRAAAGLGLELGQPAGA